MTGQSYVLPAEKGPKRSLSRQRSRDREESNVVAYWKNYLLDVKKIFVIS